MRRIARAHAASSDTGTSAPASPSITSALPGMSDARHGIPDAIASMRATLHPSETDGSTNRSASSSRARTSSR